MEAIETPAGTIEYTFTRKRVKNINLRIKENGAVVVSAPMRMAQADIEQFIRKKSVWIVKNRNRMLLKPQLAPCQYTKEECLAIFTPISDAIFPLFSDLLQGQKPVLKVREMKTRWGVCHITKRAITLNTRLAEKPLPAIEYVVLHEYVHFLHPNHQQGFHAEMERLMPDYKQRRKMLK